MVSCLILTHNEESNLPRCLASLPWCDDIVILDSFSEDRTEAVAREAGARFFQRPFDNYAAQRNYALASIQYRHPWLLMVDADEVVPADLVEEIRGRLGTVRPEVTLFRLRRKDFFLGKWIRRSSGYPTWFGRLMRVGKVRVERAINEEFTTEGEVETLGAHIHHYPFNKGFSAWVEKHNRYSSMEAALIVGGGLAECMVSELLCRDPAVRRRAQKTLFYRLPGRPLLMFMALFFIRGGFLDGRAGLTFSLLRSWYEFMITCKVNEIKRRQRGMAL